MEFSSTRLRGDATRLHATQPWKQTYTGMKFDLLDPRPEQVRLMDIGVHLSRTPRFNGATTVESWNVAQHSLLVRDILLQLYPDAGPIVQIYALLHDAHEAYTGDITTPMKMAIRAVLRSAGRSDDPVEILQHRIQKAVHRHFRLPEMASVSIMERVHRADMHALSCEKEAFMGPSPDSWGNLAPVIRGAVPKPLGAEDSAILFIRAVRECLEALGLLIFCEVDDQCSVLVAEMEGAKCERGNRELA
ncbi:hypothetical protein LDL36_20230 [Komagataeibacter sp. FNDCR1]|nr:hypothetical protein [Komagataeibacter sp. FNDCR1]